MSRTLTEQLDKAFAMEFSVDSRELGDVSNFGDDSQLPIKREEREIDTSEIEIPENDVEFVKKNMLHIMKKSMSALEDMADIARSTEKFGAFEVLNGMMKTVADLQTQYLDIEKKYAKESSNGISAQGDVNITNNIMVGNANDILSLLKNAEIEGEFTVEDE